MLDERQKKALLDLLGIVKEGEAHFNRTEQYRQELGDIMLNLELKQDENTLYMSLTRRMWEIRPSKGVKIDISDYMGIDVPSKQDIGHISLWSLDKTIESCSSTTFRDKNAADTDEVVDLLDTLFFVIRCYENNRPTNHNGSLGRYPGSKAVVSVTGMGQLRDFDIKSLQQIPDTYNTKFSNPGRIYLPQTRSGHIIQIAEQAYLN